MASPLATLGSKFRFHGDKKSRQPALSEAEALHISGGSEYFSAFNSHRILWI